LSGTSIRYSGLESNLFCSGLFASAEEHTEGMVSTDYALMYNVYHIKKLGNN